MAFEISRTEVWAGDLDDRPGALAEKLQAVLRADANLEFIVVRRDPVSPGHGVVFLAPLIGAKQHQAAAEADIDLAAGIHALRVAGPDRPGIAAGITQTLAEAGLNVVGMSAARLGGLCVLYIRFDTEEDVREAAQVLTAKLA